MAKASERGLLTTFFPGLIEASRGELTVQAQARGTWENPDLGGSVHLTGAGAYFPAAGIELKEVALDGELAGDEIRITSIRARSATLSRTTITRSTRATFRISRRRARLGWRS